MVFRRRRAGGLALGVCALAATAAGVAWGAQHAGPAPDVSRLAPRALLASTLGIVPPFVPAPAKAVAGACPRPANRLIQHAARDRREVALTFDDGPWPTTPAILAILARRKVHATFFTLGSQIEGRETILRRLRAAGHAIANHTWTHPDLTGIKPRQVRSELTRTSLAMHAVTGLEPCLVRAPYGLTSARVISQARAMGLQMIGWDVDSQDYTRPGSKKILATILRQVRPGSIVLMHDGGGRRGQTIAALPRIITRLTRRGYRLVTVPELLRHRRAPR